MHITTDDGVIPDTAFIPHHHVTDNDRGLGEIAAGAILRSLSVQFPDYHIIPSSVVTWSRLPWRIDGSTVIT